MTRAFSGPKRIFPALLAFLALLGATACSSTPVIEGPAPALLPPPPAHPPAPAAPPKGKLFREDVARVVDEGFPSFLERMDVEAYVQNDKFVGWTLLALYPPEFWANVDLRPLDVVTSVNGRPIERDTEAFDCFQAARAEPQLVVKYLRAGVPREIKFEIIPKPATPGPVATR